MRVANRDEQETKREDQRLRASPTFWSISGFALLSMRHKNQTSPIGFLSLKLPPLLCAVLLVLVILGIIKISPSRIEIYHGNENNITSSRGWETPSSCLAPAIGNMEIMQCYKSPVAHKNRSLLTTGFCKRMTRTPDRFLSVQHDVMTIMWDSMFTMNRLQCNARQKFMNNTFSRQKKCKKEQTSWHCAKRRVHLQPIDGGHTVTCL